MCLIKYFYLVQILVLAHAQNPPPPYGQLQIKGRFVEDSHGNVVQLRGMSLMASDYLSEWFNETAIYQTKCNWNSNIIRFGQMPSTPCCGGWNNTKDRDYMRMVNAVNACIKHGIYAIVDWHAFDDPQIDLAKDFFANMSKTFSGQ
uniref:Glycoside hydrolase family 5 domain-containing protein n=1 Tax=Acrobeloides nanus TaxID=290746 RepID=A0A914C4E1_9BILA